MWDFNLLFISWLTQTTTAAWGCPFRTPFHTLTTSTQILCLWELVHFLHWIDYSHNSAWLLYICLHDSQYTVCVCMCSGWRIRERLHLHPGSFAPHHGRFLEDGVGAKRQDNRHGDSSETQGHSKNGILSMCVCVCVCVCELLMLWGPKSVYSHKNGDLCS